MATSSPPEAFVWGAGGAKLSPAEVARQREIAAALMQGGMDYSPVDHWMQGAARAAQGLAGGLKERWANEAAQSGREGFQSQLSSIFGGGSSAPSPVASALVGGSPVSSANSGTGDAFLDALVNSESGGNWQALNNEGYGGRLQFGEARLADAARAGVIPAGITGGDFSMMSPEVQRAVEAWHFNDIDQQAVNMGLDKYYGQTIAGVPINQNSIRSMAHLGGIGGAQKFVTSGGQYNPADSNGTRLSDYGSRFGGMSAGGAPSQPAPVQVAQAGGGGSGVPSVAELLSLSGNEWATPAQSSVLNALIGQQLEQQDPMYQLQRQKAELEIQQLLTPSAPKPVFEGGQWWDISSGMPNALTEAAASTGFDTITLDVPGVGPQTFNTADPQQRQAANQLLGQGATEVRAPGVNVSVGGSAPAPAQGYQNIFDENGRLVRQEMVEGSAPWLEAQAAAAAAAAQEDAQIASDIETAEKTLTSTKNVLDILDNSGGQPTTGTLSIPFATLSGTPAGRIRSYVSTLQSGVALGAMQRLKEASATGATGFGALSAPELNLLISDIGALDPNNAEPDIFRETIQRIDGRTKRVVADIRKNVSPERIEELGLREFLDAVDPEGAKPSVDPNDIDALLELYK